MERQCGRGLRGERFTCGLRVRAAVLVCVTVFVSVAIFVCVAVFVCNEYVAEGRNPSASVMNGVVACA